MSKISDMLNNPRTITIISFIWGMGVAFILLNRCMDGHCVVIQGPPQKEIQNKVFKVDDVCFTFEPKVTDCVKDAISEKK